MSAKNTLDVTDAKKTARSAAVFYLPVLLAVLVSIQNGHYDIETLKNVAIASAISVTADLIRRYMADNTSAKP
ncbi:MAG: hypothetical protein WA194_07145 [Patescibacteria group bacterium]